MKKPAMLGLILAICAAQIGSSASASQSVQTQAAGDQTVEYTLAPGDKIRVVVFGEDTLSGDYVIASSGNLSFPLIGNLKATGATVEALQASLATALSNGYLNNPRVNIQMISFRPFFILGEVNRPGEYPVSTGLTLQQAVASAGGYTYRANTRSVLLKHSDETQERLVDLRETSAIIIRAGDTIRIRERHF
jgi:polysaccharide export outer membrane protein